MGNPFPGPQSPYQNPPIQPQFFQPSQFVITGISFGTSTTFTTAKNANYVIGQLVRIIIPESYGSYQLNEQTGYVTAIPAGNQVTVNINSIGVNPFISTPTFLPYQNHTPPQIVSVGSTNTGKISLTGPVQTNVTIPGAFENISPI